MHVLTFIIIIHVILFTADPYSIEEGLVPYKDLQGHQNPESSGVDEEDSNGEMTATWQVCVCVFMCVCYVCMYV